MFTSEKNIVIDIANSIPQIEANTPAGKSKAQSGVQYLAWFRKWITSIWMRNFVSWQWDRKVGKVLRPWFESVNIYSSKKPAIYSANPCLAATVSSVNIWVLMIAMIACVGCFGWRNGQRNLAWNGKVGNSWYERVFFPLRFNGTCSCMSAW